LRALFRRHFVLQQEVPGQFPKLGVFEYLRAGGEVFKIDVGFLFLRSMTLEAVLLQEWNHFLLKNGGGWGQRLFCKARGMSQRGSGDDRGPFAENGCSFHVHLRDLISK